MKERLQGIVTGTSSDTAIVDIFRGEDAANIQNAYYATTAEAEKAIKIILLVWLKILIKQITLLETQSNLRLQQN